MKLVFLNYTTEIFSPVDGNSLSTYIWEICQCARRDGIEPIVMTQNHDKAKYEWPNTIYVPPPELPGNPWLYKWQRVKRKISRWPHLRHEVYAQRVAEALRKIDDGELTLVLQNDVEIAIYLRQRFPSMRIVVLFQNYHRIKRFFEGDLKSSADVVAAVSRATGKWVEEVYGMPAGSVATIHSGVDLEKYRPATTRPEGLPMVNFTGRICPEKAPDLLLRAAIKVAKHQKSFAVQFLGWGKSNCRKLTPYEQELEVLGEKLEDAGVKIRRPGRLDRHALPAEVREASIHVTPSRWEEAFGLVTLEAMASGLAVIGTNTGGTPEIIGDAGFVIERDDVDALADRLDRLICDRTLREEYAMRARQRAMEFSWDRTWKQMRGLVESVQCTKGRKDMRHPSQSSGKALSIATTSEAVN